MRDFKTQFGDKRDGNEHEMDGDSKVIGISIREIGYTVIKFEYPMYLCAPPSGTTVALGFVNE